MKLTVISVAVDALAMVYKSFKKDWRNYKSKEKIDNIQTTLMLRRTRILRSVARTSESPFVITSRKSSQLLKQNNDINKLIDIR